MVDQFMNAFTDHRDSEVLIISHFSLLLGCTIPKWMSSGFNDRPLAPFGGILSLGIGDTMASTVIKTNAWKIWPFRQMVHQFMNAFSGHRDSEILIISHFSLLLGCAIPKWVSSSFNVRPLAPFAGILSLGIGDTMASMVGHKYGVLRWSKTGKKTIEGTAAVITSVVASCAILLPLLASTGYILSQHWLSLVVAVILTGLLEAYRTQLDNAFISLTFYCLLCFLLPALGLTGQLCRTMTKMSNVFLHGCNLLWLPPILLQALQECGHIDHGYQYTT